MIIPDSDLLSKFDSADTDKMESYLVGESADDVAAIVVQFVENWSDTHHEIYMAGVDGAPDWQLFENEIWSLGVVLQKLIKNHNKWKKNANLSNAIADIAINKKYKKGRQSFVWILGDFGGTQCGKLLGSLLDDPEVNGHAIKALNKAKILGYENMISPFLKKENGWLRKEAAKYIAMGKSAEAQNSNRDR